MTGKFETPRAAFVTLLFTWLVDLPVHAQAIPGVTIVKEYKEAPEQLLNVSGESVAGISVAPSTGSAGSWHSLRVFVPGDLGAETLRLHVEVVSADAKYRGLAELQLEGRQGWVELPIKPTMSRLKPFLNAQALAVSVRRVDGRREYLVADWSGGAADAGSPPEHIQVFVNGRRGDIWLQGRSCEKVQLDSRRMFDHRCAVTLQEASFGDDGWTFSVQRREGFTREQPQKIPLALPSPAR